VIPSHKKIFDRARAYRKACVDIVQERKAIYVGKTAEELAKIDIKQKDLLDLLIEHHIQGNDDSLTDAEIVDEFISFLLAGMDTTGHLLTMVLYHLHEHPDYLEKLREEIDIHYKGKDKSEITVDSINKMEFMNVIIKETLRYSTPVNGIFPKESLQDHMIGNFKVRKGDLIQVGIVMNHFNPKNHDNPEVFNPYRWLDPESKSRKADHFAFIPFSAGQRNCIGQHLSMIEMKIVLSEFLLKFDYKLADGYVHRMVHKSLYAPEMDVLLNLKKR